MDVETETYDGLSLIEKEKLRKIHGVDQRSPEVTFNHPVLSDAVRVRQMGATSAQFVPGTSSVIWPCAYALAHSLCEAAQAVRDNPLVDAATLSTGPDLKLVGMQTFCLEGN